MRAKFLQFSSRHHHSFLQGGPDRSLPQHTLTPGTRPLCHRGRTVARGAHGWRDPSPRHRPIRHGAQAGRPPAFQRDARRARCGCPWGPHPGAPDIPRLRAQPADSGSLSGLNWHKGKLPKNPPNKQEQANNRPSG